MLLFSLRIITRLPRYKCFFFSKFGWCFLGFPVSKKKTVKFGAFLSSDTKILLLSGLHLSEILYFIVFFIRLRKIWLLLGIRQIHWRPKSSKSYHDFCKKRIRGFRDLSISKLFYWRIIFLWLLVNTENMKPYLLRTLFTEQWNSNSITFVQ